MSENPFFKQQQQKNSHHRPDKSQMHEKCVAVLNQIQKYSQEIYDDLHRTFVSTYDRPNVQKKKVLGFYGTLVEKLKGLKSQAGENLVSQAPPTHSLAPLAEFENRPVSKPTPKTSSKSENKKSSSMREDKNIVVKKAHKKTVEAEKKVVKKTASDSAKKVVKKVEKKVEKKTAAKKAAPKTAAKKAPAKKAAVKKTGKKK